MDDVFPRYRAFNPKVPVWDITPKGAPAIHRFFDTSPISPSGRYIALTRFPYDTKPPAPGDAAHVIVIDLTTGQEARSFETYAWDTQLGAQVQWGKTDDALFFNALNLETWNLYAVCANVRTGEMRTLNHEVYMVSHDGTKAVSPCLKRIGATQPGYGVHIPAGMIPRNEGAPSDDGVYVIDTKTGAYEMLVSIKDIVDTVRDDLSDAIYDAGDFYIFHTKWSFDDARLMVVLRFVPHACSIKNPIRPMLVTMRADGSDIRLAVPHEEWRGKGGGHHPNWLPDNTHIIMNLYTYGVENGMRFMKVRYDGGTYEALSHVHKGSGHPTLHPNMRHLVTDTYQHEKYTREGGETPLRVIDLTTDTCEELVLMDTAPRYPGPKRIWRVDPHPAWDRSYRALIFNGCPEGRRRVFIADMSSIVCE